MTANLISIHLAHLRRSGLTDETIAQAGISSVAPQDLRRILGYLPKGFVSAYQIPYSTGFCRWRLFYENGDGRKYLQRKGSGNHLYIPPAVKQKLSDPAMPLYIVEGEKKALRGLQEGLCAIGISGLWNYTNGNGALISDFSRIAWDGREVHLVPDNDYRSRKHGYKNGTLTAAVWGLADALRDRGALVDIVELPAGPDKGLDDYLQKHDIGDFLALPRLDPDSLLELEEWSDPVPFDDFSLLPEFPLDCLPDNARHVVTAVAKCNQVDPVLPATICLGMIAAAVAKKAVVDLQSHIEPLNVYLVAVAPSGERKTKTMSDLTTPIYQYQRERQSAMAEVIREAQARASLLKRRLDKLEKQAASEDNGEARRELEGQVLSLAREIAQNPVPVPPVLVMDDVTPEALGARMADNDERTAVFSTEGGLFGILAGRYNERTGSNMDLVLKAHSGDPWSSDRIGRDTKTMASPALTIMLTVQPEVIAEIGRVREFRGKGLLARILYAKCKPQAGHRKRRIQPVHPDTFAAYRELILSLLEMEVPSEPHVLTLSPDAQRIWDGFYEDVEKSMRSGGGLEHLKDWGSKLPGAVGRISGLLHFCKHGREAVRHQITEATVLDAATIGGYCAEHAAAVFGLMREDSRIESARTILEYLRRHKPARFKGRDVLAYKSAPKTMDDITPGLKVLVERGYLRPRKAPASRRGRPEAVTYEVNPKTYENHQQ